VKRIALAGHGFDGFRAFFPFIPSIFTFRPASWEAFVLRDGIR
jgi:hypothetical protein